MLVLTERSLKEAPTSSIALVTLIFPWAMAWLKATAMATRPFWSEYRILAWEPTTCREKDEKRHLSYLVTCG